MSRRMLMGSKRMGVVKDGVIQDEWETIIKICQSGQANQYYQVGDHAYINELGCYFDYLGTGLDSRADGKSGPVTTWLCRTLVGHSPIHQSANTINARYNWDNSLAKTYTKSNFYDLLPSNIRDNIVPVNKKCQTMIPWYTKPTIEVSTCVEYYWIPSQDEIVDTYKERFPDAISRTGRGSSSPVWWLRDYNSSKNNFCVGVHYSSGNITDGYECSYNGMIVPGFCI